MACLQSVPNRTGGVPCVLRMIALSLCKHCKKVITNDRESVLGMLRLALGTCVQGGHREALNESVLPWPGKAEAVGSQEGRH